MKGRMLPLRPHRSSSIAPCVHACDLLRSRTRKPFLDVVSGLTTPIEILMLTLVGNERKCHMALAANGRKEDFPRLRVNAPRTREVPHGGTGRSSRTLLC
ncbi:hypothetical protein CBM2634_P140010 [Cupriavidus taiwanensis]|uniref:Uncharacterized protein n=1 Tax=Cupriavidus taiwanensis TaxID=164546 RepID=A0A375JF08_9BURK|nr:hypothetical protein CBM2634_P140010 [Cupriavidus taiwanensis]